MKRCVCVECANDCLIQNPAIENCPCGAKRHNWVRVDAPRALVAPVLHRLFQAAVSRYGSMDAAEKKLKEWKISWKRPTKDQKRRRLNKANKKKQKLNSVKPRMSFQSLGYKTYAEYLESDLWKSIRGEVLARDEHKCRLCGEVTRTVHHNSYALDVMAGRDHSQLFSLCVKCHHAVEFDGSTKRSHQNARKEFIRLLGAVG